MSTKFRTLSLSLPHCTVSLGWHLAGPGPARYGYGARTAAGQVIYLGRTRAAALARAAELGSSYGSGGAMKQSKPSLPVRMHSEQRMRFHTNATIWLAAPNSKRDSP